MREIKFKAWDPELNRMFNEDEIEESEIIKTYLSYGKLVIGCFPRKKDYYELIPIQYTGKVYPSGRSICEGDIAFEEIEHDQGDERQYYVCVWIKEWCRFAWLNIIGEYPNYLELGEESLDIILQETYGVTTENFHYAGNIYENQKLLRQ